MDTKLHSIINTLPGDLLENSGLEGATPFKYSHLGYLCQTSGV